MLTNWFAQKLRFEEEEMVEMPYRGGGTCSKLGAQLLNGGQTLGVQNLPFHTLRLKYWVRKPARYVTKYITGVLELVYE